jgi:dienelactone hydrolase
MGQDPGTAGAPVTDAKDPEQIREDIEATRRELGDTVEALAAKADVKAQVGRRIESTKASARANPAPLVVAGVCLGALVVWRLTRR